MTIAGDIVVFLPWLHLKGGSRFSIGPVSFVSIDSDCSKLRTIFGSECADLKKIISSYKNIEGKEVKNVTVLFYNDKWKLIGNKNEDLISEVARIAAFAAISKNEFFTGGNGRYANASLFQPVFQAYREGFPGLAFALRRRAGRCLNGGYEHGKVNITEPFECQDIRDVEVDANLATALWNAREKPVGRRIIIALSFFCLANTDSDSMESDAEVILMASAFDQVFEIQSDNAYQLTCKLGVLLDGYDSVKVERAKARKIKGHL